MKIDPKPLNRHTQAAMPCSVQVTVRPRDAYPLRIVVTVAGRTQRLYMTSDEAKAFRFDIGMALCDPK